MAIGFTSERDSISVDEGPYVSCRTDLVGQRLNPFPLVTIISSPFSDNSIGQTRWQQRCYRQMIVRKIRYFSAVSLLSPISR